MNVIDVIGLYLSQRGYIIFVQENRLAEIGRWCAWFWQFWFPCSEKDARKKKGAEKNFKIIWRSAGSVLH